ncbi:MAG TPA: hypothetical protein PLI09_09380 [Candidatus Hydrogenedentes bacterium]|nr:hypothetical protein [Candidatus Hydrogenedentota bacterium]
MRAYYCDCGQKMRVPEERLNRRGHCPRCGRIVTVTWDNTLPSNKMRPAQIERHAKTPAPPPHPELITPEPYPQALITPMVDHPIKQDSEDVSAEASTPGDKETPPQEIPSDPSLLPPIPEAEAPAVIFPPKEAPQLQENSLELLLNAIAAAIDFRKWIFAFVILLIWMTGGGVLLFTAYIHWMLSLALGILWGAVCWGAGIGYLARLIHIRLNEKRVISFSHSERFFSRRFFDLMLALAVPCIPIAAMGILLNGVLFLLSHTPESSSGFTVAILAPAVIINGVLLLIAITSALIPCIIAVDDVPLRNALNRLSRLIINRPGALFAALGCSLGLAFILMTGTGGIAALALYGTLNAAHILLTGPDGLLHSQTLFQNGWDTKMILLTLSTGLILTVFLSIIITLFTACLTFTYRWTSRKA